VAEEKTKTAKTDKKRGYVAQSDFPRTTLAKALTIATALWENFAGKGAAPIDVALALDLTPTSGSWRNLCGASLAYGLTEGGYNAKEIVLTDLGRRCVAPQAEGDDVAAKVEALLQPTIMRGFLEKYDRAKFPQENIAENVLVGLGLPKDRAQAAVNVLKENGILTGVLRETKTGLVVSLGSPSVQPPRIDLEADATVEKQATASELSDEAIAAKVAGVPDAPNPAGVKPPVNRVFISHGKNRKIVDQLKELLTFGKFAPIVSVDKEATSIPVPDKVFEDMRSCSAAVINVSQEGELLDSEGNKHVQLNENVLIEIGAAIALYDKNFVLLVQKGVVLPSNLQGLYRCEYEGEQLDYDATMKLLKTFNQFK
jgi:predicted nucleotide-binding protein